MPDDHTSDDESEAQAKKLRTKYNLIHSSMPSMSVPVPKQVTRGSLPERTLQQLLKEIADAFEQDVKVLDDRLQPKKSKGNKVRAAVKHDKRRLGLLRTWLGILTIDYTVTRVGEQLRKAETLDEKLEILKFTFAGRSNNTLIARSAPVLKYLSWRPAQDLKWLPDEEDLYKFMAKNCNSSQPLSRAKSTMEAFTFVAHVCRATRELLDALESPLLIGMAVHNYSMMPERKQAADISVESFIKLEVLLHNQALEDVKHMVLGAAVLCGYLRSRFDDSNQISRIHLEERVAIAKVKKTKTTRVDDRLPKFMMAPLCSLSGVDVIHEYLEWRTKKGAPVGEFPLFPALVNGKWTSDAAALSDINAILKSIFIEAQLKEVDVSSHSFKAFFLTLLGKAGVSKVVLGILGYHKGEVSGSVRSYARDLLSPHIDKMAEIIMMVVDGVFKPDNKPGEMWSSNVPNLEEKLASCSEEEHDDNDTVTESEIDRSSSESESDSNAKKGTGFGLEVLAEAMAPNGKVRDGRLFVSNTNRIHCGLSGSLTQTFCTTSLLTCEPLAAGTDLDEEEENRLCKNCFGRNASKARKLQRALSNLDDD